MVIISFDYNQSWLITHKDLQLDEKRERSETWAVRVEAPKGWFLDVCVGVLIQGIVAVIPFDRTSLPSTDPFRFIVYLPSITPGSESYYFSAPLPYPMNVSNRRKRL